MTRLTWTWLLCLFMALDSLADEPLSESGLKTSAFAMIFPTGWKLEQKKSPIPLRGQHGERILIYAILPNPEKEVPSAVAGEKIREFWRKKIREELSSAVTRDGMTVTVPLEESQVQGLPFFSAASHRQRDGSFLAAYGLVGKKEVVFIVTVEGWIDDEATSRKAVEQMLRTITWNAN